MDNGLEPAAKRDTTEPPQPPARPFSATRLSRLWALASLCLIGWAVWWFITHPTIRIEDLAFSPSDVDPKPLVERMLRVNKPWLEPRPVEGSYALRRTYHLYSLTHGFKREEQALGPYQIEPGCSRTMRVGSMVVTPLQAMTGRRSNNYTARMVGQTKWKGRSVLAIDVRFSPAIRCGVGMGGQKGASYSSATFPVDTTRIFIEPLKAVPVLLLTSSMIGSPGLKHETTWEFSAPFYELADGVAPRAFDWGDHSDFHEHQEFQIVDGGWIFKKGRATFSVGPILPTRSFLENCLERVKNLGHCAQELQLVNLQLNETNRDPLK